jgi:hypothetical protein
MLTTVESWIVDEVFREGLGGVLKGRLYGLLDDTVMGIRLFNQLFHLFGTFFGLTYC